MSSQRPDDVISTISSDLKYVSGFLQGICQGLAKAPSGRDGKHMNWLLV